MGQRSALVARPAGHVRRLAAVALAALGVLALGAGLLVEPSAPPAVPASRPATSSAARAVGALTARLIGPLSGLPTGPVPVALATFSIPVGGRLVLAAVPGPVILGAETGVVNARVDGSTARLAASTEAVAPPFQVAAGGETAVPGSEAVLIAPDGSAIELTNVGTGPAAGAFVAFGTETVAAPDGTAVRLVAGGQLDPPPAGPLWLEATRWSLAPGAIVPAHEADGPELVVLAAGTVQLALHPGKAVIRRSYGGEEWTSGEPGDPLAARTAEDAGHRHEVGSAGPVRPAGPAPLWGSVSGLAAGDAAFLQMGSTRTLQGVGPTPAVVWVVAIVPAEPAPGMPPP